MFYLFYRYSHGLDFDNHGLFNIIGYFALLAILIILFIPFNILIFVIKKKNVKISIICIVIIISVILSVFTSYMVIVQDCKDWSYGLNNSYIENNTSKYGCQIVFPKNCPYKFFNKFLDYTKIIGKNCESYLLEGSKKNLLSYSKSPFLNDKVNRIGYPLTNKNPICYLDLPEDFNYVEDYFFKNLVDMDNKKILEKYFRDQMPEVEVDFTNNTQGKLKICLNYNNTLSEERILLEKGNNPYSSNVLILYIDSVSRANSIRNLKKTTKFIEQFMSYQGGFHEKYPSENYHSFQFFKYHSFKFHTGYNFPILFYGEKKFSNKVLITKYFKENGYVTAYTGDFCYRDNIRVYHNSTPEETYDHQFIICDPNNDHFNINTVKCLYGKKTTEHLYEYGLQFWRKYKNNRKFLSIISNDGHEGTLEVLKYTDDIVFNFLNELYNDNLLKDTTVFLLSDHGVGMPSFYFWNSFYMIEENLPMLYMIVNDRKNITYEHQYKYLYENQQSFITGFDIYNTFGNIIFGDSYKSIINKTSSQDTAKSELGISLFDKINQKARSPEMYQFSSKIKKDYCVI